MDEFYRYVAEILKEPFAPLAKYFTSNITMAEIATMDAADNDDTAYWLSKGLNPADKNFWIKSILMM